MNDEPSLRELLRTSLPDVSVPAHFRAEVWQRIQARADAPATRGWAWVFGLFARPVFASVAFVLALGGAVGAASLHAEEMNGKARTVLAGRHVATLDPYAHLTAAR